MIYGIGIDMAEIDRIETKIQANDYFKHHVYSENEIIYCESKKKSSMHFAARWAVKEAFLKAFGVRFIGNHRLPEIETIHDEFGKPSIQLIGKMKEEFEEKINGTIHLSITHSNNIAIAYVIIEKEIIHEQQS